MWRSSPPPAPAPPSRSGSTCSASAFVGFVAALGGGILRDLVIGAVPPLAFSDWRYAVTAVVASVAVFWLHPQLNRLRRTVLLLDAAGLGLFTVTGTLKALDAGVPPVGACLVGMLTAIGGGLARDLLTGEIPAVLQRDIYAVVALGGAVAVTVLSWLDAAGPVPLAVAAAADDRGTPARPLPPLVGARRRAVARGCRCPPLCWSRLRAIRGGVFMRVKGSSQLEPAAAEPGDLPAAAGLAAQGPGGVPAPALAPTSWRSRPRAPARPPSPCASPPSCWPTARSRRSRWSARPST